MSEYSKKFNVNFLSDQRDIRSDLFTAVHSTLNDYINIMGRKLVSPKGYRIRINAKHKNLYLTTIVDDETFTTRVIANVFGITWVTDIPINHVIVEIVGL